MQNNKWFLPFFHFLVKKGDEDQTEYVTSSELNIEEWTLENSAHVKVLLYLEKVAFHPILGDTTLLPPFTDRINNKEIYNTTSLCLLLSRVWHLVSRLLGIDTFLNFLWVLVSVLKIFGLKKSLGIGLENFVSKKSLGIGLENI